MSARRELRPSVLATDGRVVWVIDDVAPVAAVLDAVSGAVLDVVSWRDLAPPPAAIVPGSRRVLADGHRVVVRDDRAAQSIELGPGSATVRPLAAFEALGGSPFASALGLGRTGAGHRDGLALGGPYRLLPTPAARRHECRCSVSVGHATPAPVPLGVGRVTAALLVGDELWACVRRAPPRPWTWRPRASLLRVAVTGTVTEALEPLDVGDACWEPHRGAVELTGAADRTVRLSGRYWAERDGADPELGVTDVRVVRRGTGVDAVMETWFCAASRPGVRLVHSTELFDELGSPIFDSVFLAEEMPHLPPVGDAVDGVLRL